MAQRYVSLQQLIDETGFAKRTLLLIQRHEPNVLPRDAKGRYRQPDCAANLRTREVEKLKKKAAEEAAPDSVKDANRRQAIAEAALAELKLQREQEKVVDKAVLFPELRHIFRLIRVALLGMRNQHKHRLVMLPDEAAASRELYAIALVVLASLQQAGPIIAEAIEGDAEHEVVEVPAERRRGRKKAA